MKWKIKRLPKILFENDFLLFPTEHNGYMYWWCWVTIKLTLEKIPGYSPRYSREIIDIGKNAANYTEWYEKGML